jgi:hypothetical protein
MVKASRCCVNATFVTGDWQAVTAHHISQVTASWLRGFRACWQSNEHLFDSPVNGVQRKRPLRG